MAGSSVKLAMASPQSRHCASFRLDLEYSMKSSHTWGSITSGSILLGMILMDSLFVWAATRSQTTVDRGSLGNVLMRAKLPCRKGYEARGALHRQRNSWQSASKRSYHQPRKDGCHREGARRGTRRGSAPAQLIGLMSAHGGCAVGRRYLATKKCFQLQRLAWLASGSPGSS